MKSMTGTFPEVHDWLTIQLSQAPVVYVGEWQAISAGLPQEETIELEDVSFEIPIGGSDTDSFAAEIGPNLPWAEEHFLERVSGLPWNPPPSHVRWPFAQSGNDGHMDQTKFSHTYPERFWPRSLLPDGIRYGTGDLSSLVRILQQRLGSRQAYLPVWFPEDLHAAEFGQRVPCTLGYHFLIRNNKLKIVYYIRSCDFYRHFRDDVYMAGRLAQWVATQLENIEAFKLVMHVSSMHIFKAEKTLIDQQAKDILGRNMIKVW